MNAKQVEVMATYILKTVLSDIGKSLEEDSRNETQTSVSSALYGVAHQLQHFDHDWHLGELCKAVAAVPFDAMPEVEPVNHWEAELDFTPQQWAEEVAADETRSGYVAWVQARREQAKEDATNGI